MKLFAGGPMLTIGARYHLAMHAGTTPLSLLQSYKKISTNQISLVIILSTDKLRIPKRHACRQGRNSAHKGHKRYYDELRN